MEPDLAALFDDSILVGLDAKNSSAMTARHYRSVFTPSLPYPTKVTETEEKIGNDTFVKIEKESSYKSFYDDLWMQREDNVIDGYLGKFYKDVDASGKGNFVDGMCTEYTFC